MKIIATDIANLTDARYFAAWGVDMMCYNIEAETEGSLTPAKLKEIVDWVEGPVTGIKMAGLAVPATINDVEFALENAIVSPFIEKADLPDNITNVYRICTLDDIPQDDDKLILTLDTPVAQLSSVQSDKIKSIASSKIVFLDGIFTSSDLDTITALGVEGIILKGGEEEKVGYKSFDELDDLLEALFE